MHTEYILAIIPLRRRSIEESPWFIVVADWLVVEARSSLRNHQEWILAGGDEMRFCKILVGGVEFFVIF